MMQKASYYAQKHYVFTLKNKPFSIKKRLIITVLHQFSLHTIQHPRIVHCNTATYGCTRIMPFSRPNDFIFKITQSEEVCKNQIERKQKTNASKSKTKTGSPNGKKFHAT